MHKLSIKYLCNIYKTRKPGRADRPRPVGALQRGGAHRCLMGTHIVGISFLIVRQALTQYYALVMLATEYISNINAPICAVEYLYSLVILVRCEEVDKFFFSHNIISSLGARSGALILKLALYEWYNAL